MPENMVYVKMVDAQGLTMPIERLETLYADTMNFRPYKRKSNIRADKMVEIAIKDDQAALHARIDVPGFGDLWITADNCGRGYSSNQTIDFVYESAQSRLYQISKEYDKDNYSQTFRNYYEEACKLIVKYPKYEKEYKSNMDALANALWAGELMVIEKAKITIKQSAPRRDFLFGANAFKYKQNGSYAKHFDEIFNFATLPFYLSAVEVDKFKPDYELLDRLVNEVGCKGIKLKGHPMFWGNTDCNPEWMKNLSFEDLKREIERTIIDRVTKYKDKVKVWDAINEAHDFANGFYLNHSQEIEVTKLCCDTIRKIDSEAVIIINVCAPFGEYVADGKMSHGPILENSYSSLSYLDDVFKAEIDFDVIGIQLYFPVRDMYTVNQLLNEYIKFGKPIHITEMAAGSQTPPVLDKSNVQLDYTNGRWHRLWDETLQADWMEWFYTLCYSKKQINALTWWDFNDPAFIHKGGFLNEDDSPKEIFFRLKHLQQWFRENSNEQ